MKKLKFACAVGAAMTMSLVNVVYAQGAEFPLKSAYAKSLTVNPTYSGSVISPSKGTISIERHNAKAVTSFASVKQVHERDVVATLTLDSAPSKRQVSLERNYYGSGDRYVGSITGKVEDGVFKPAAYEKVTEFHPFPAKVKVPSSGLVMNATVYSDPDFSNTLKTRSITYQLSAIKGSTVTALLKMITKDSDGVVSTASFRIGTDGGLVRLSERSETPTFLLDVVFNK